MSTHQNIYNFFYKKDKTVYEITTESERNFDEIEIKDLGDIYHAKELIAEDIRNKDLKLVLGNIINDLILIQVNVKLINCSPHLLQLV